MSVVLIVDDNEINRFMAVHVLQTRGFTVIQASDGIEALRLTRDEHPDVVVLDIQMPGMSGLEVLSRMRASHDPAIARTPVLAATALAMPSDRERCFAAGANRFLARPFSMKALVEEVRALIPATGEAGDERGVAE